MPRVSAAFSDARARRVFLTLVLTGLRRFELQALRWRHVNLVEGTLRVDVSKSEEGERLISLPPMLVDALMEQFTSTAYRSDDDYVFCHPKRGTPLEDEWYRRGVPRGARRGRGWRDHVRAFHDMRHTALTNLAATGASPIAVMATAGHRSMQTTKELPASRRRRVPRRRREPRAADARGTKFRYKVAGNGCDKRFWLEPALVPEEADHADDRRRPSAPRSPRTRRGCRSPGTRRSSRRCRRSASAATAMTLKIVSTRRTSFCRCEMTDSFVDSRPSTTSL